MDSIYEMMDGTYVDLERIVSVGKPTSWNNWANISFPIFFQLKKEPIDISFAVYNKVMANGFKWKTRPKGFIETESEYMIRDRRERYERDANFRMKSLEIAQIEVDKFIAVWQTYKRSKELVPTELHGY